jgi:hypothetical protein
MPLLTTRREPKFGQLDRTPVYTERLVGPTLIPFIFEYLRRRQLEGAFDQRQQLKLGGFSAGRGRGARAKRHSAARDL